jgi:molybdopterin converting factor small subunit
MSVTFFIPGPLRPYTNGQAQVVVRGDFSTVGAALAALCAAHPGVRDRVLTEGGEVREHVNLFVGNECVRYRQGLATPIPDGADISIVPAITGGRAPRDAG